MSAGEKRLLMFFLLALGLAATALHVSSRLEVEAEIPEAAVELPSHDEAALLKLGAGAQRLEPANPPGSWRLAWQGAPPQLLGLLQRVEARPGGYFVASTVLRELAPGLWSLEVVLSPTQEGLTGPPGATDFTKLAASLGWAAAPARAARRTEPPPRPASIPATVPTVPTVQTVTGALELLGTYGGGAGQHWWIKEKATDRVFQVPGTDDWSLVQADGTGLVLQRAGIQYQVEIRP